MKVLSFDTSTNCVHVALFDGRELVCSHVAAASQEHRQEVAGQLLPAIDRSVLEAGWPKSAIDAIVVGIGPGGFTSIRVAVVTARSLGQALGLPVVGISSFDRYAFLSPRPVGIVLTGGASAGSCFVAVYGTVEGEPLAMKFPPSYVPAERLQELTASVSVTMGDPRACAELNSNALNLTPLPDIENVAVVQGELAISCVLSQYRDRSRLQLSDALPWSKVLPLYLREPSVTLKKDSKT